MKRYGYISLVLTFALVGCKQKPDMSVTYPETYRSDSVLVFFGDTVVHPYSWLEAVQSDTTKAWLAVQDSLTSDYLSKIPFRAKIRKDLDSVDAYPRRQQMEKHGYAYYLFENIDSCYNLYEMDSLGNKLRFLLDINTLSKADSAMILNFRLSDNGRYLAYLFSTPKDSSGNNIRIRDVELNQDLPETIDSVQYTWIAWKDNQLYYTFFDKDSKKWGIFCHQPNSLQDADSMFLHHYCINASFSEDKRFLYLIDNSYFCIKPMDKPNSNLVYVFEKENIDGLDNIQNIGDDIYLLAYQDKYMKLNINSGKPQWDTIFSAGKGDFLSWACIVDDKIVASHLHNSYSRLYVYDMDGSNQTELPLPCIGTVRSSLIDNTTFYYDFSSFAVPSTLYRIQDIHRLEAQVFKVDNPNVRSEDFITEQIWCTSKDSTRVPFFITYKKNMQRNGTNPILLYGYGGFNNIMYPSFSPLFYSFFEKGGIFVRASLRGDGGFGKEWYEAGIKENKQNTFDDFIAVAEY
ncbi:MAG: prolyl oligopeptidase family serine peptidase, partial [Tannerella sp.]|nr:prolyl oligopeptidase family serine peptidase [Tannerella sp.]